MDLMEPLNERSLSQNFQVSMFKQNWDEALHDQGFVLQAVLTLVVSFAIIFYMPDFFARIQMRSGVVLNDPVLDYLKPRDVSGYLFFLLYSSILLAAAYMIFFPRNFIWGVQAYCLLTIMRGITVYFIPLDPSPELIPLTDPVITHFFYHSPGITKDLFFSGHTATIFMIALVVHQRTLKIIFTVVTLVIGALVMVQHIHYSYDVFAAPFFAWLSVFIVQSVGRIWHKIAGQKPGDKKTYPVL